MFKLWKTEALERFLLGGVCAQQEEVGLATVVNFCLVLNHAADGYL